MLRAHELQLDWTQLPSLDRLTRTSSVLAALGGVPPAGRSIEEVALAEFMHYSAQTYLYELIGFQLLGELSAGANTPEVVHAFATQSIDEAEHARTYGHVLERCGEIYGLKLDWRSDFSRAQGLLLNRGVFEEKVVVAFCVLESLAVGIFGARLKAFGDTALGALDQRTLREEATHQRVGLEILRELQREGRMVSERVQETVRESAELVGRLLAPDCLLMGLGIDPTPEMAARVLNSGLLREQRDITQRALVRATRSAQRVSCSI